MDRKKLLLCIGLLAILALLGCGSKASAYPALMGMTGGVQTPSPQVVPPGQYDLAVDYTKLKGDGGDIQAWPIRLVGGASERAELGIAYTRLKHDQGGSAKITDFGAKYLVLTEPEAAYSLAVGANFAKFGGDLDAKTTRLYAVLGKDLTPESDEYWESPATQTLGYVGLMYTRYANEDTETATRPFAGIEMVGAGGGSLALEWKSEKYGDDVTSAVLRYQFNPAMMGEVGITKNLGGIDMLGDSHRVFLGLNYRFGQPEEEAWEW